MNNNYWNAKESVKQKIDALPDWCPLEKVKEV